tara:strand:- start:810 stop:998 length:189 start_codon:yes stop_codon:yes gene_type:complete
MDYREGYLELLAERSTLKGKNKALLAALENLIPYLEAQASQADEVFAVLDAREAIAKAQGGE